jgi:RimJ/RimL family protein N-acetyltransferase
MTVVLRRMDDALLERLLRVAVAEADPDEAMPPLEGPPGWTPARREAFKDYHRSRIEGLESAHREVTFAVMAGSEVVGAARLAEVDRPGVLEAGLWLARSARGRGRAGEVLSLLLVEAASAGASVVVAETTAGNAAALAVLRRSGARLIAVDPEGRVHAEMTLADHKKPGPR